MGISCSIFPGPKIFIFARFWFQRGVLLWCLAPKSQSKSLYFSKGGQRDKRFRWVWRHSIQRISWSLSEQITWQGAEILGVGASSVCPAFSEYVKIVIGLYPRYSQNLISNPVVLFCMLNSKFTQIEGCLLSFVCSDWAGPTCTRCATVDECSNHYTYARWQCAVSFTPNAGEFVFPLLSFSPKGAEQVDLQCPDSWTSVVAYRVKPKTIHATTFIPDSHPHATVRVLKTPSCVKCTPHPCLPGFWGQTGPQETMACVGGGESGPTRSQFENKKQCSATSLWKKTGGGGHVLQTNHVFLLGGVGVMFWKAFFFPARKIRLPPPPGNHRTYRRWPPCRVKPLNCDFLTGRCIMRRGRNSGRRLHPRRPQPQNSPSVTPTQNKRIYEAAVRETGKLH